MSTFCAEHGITRKTFYAIRNRAKAEGQAAALDNLLASRGLRVTAAWTIATETDSALKSGNYVQGTVLLVLLKRKYHPKRCNFPPMSLA